MQLRSELFEVDQGCIIQYWNVLIPKCIYGSMELVGKFPAGASSIALNSVEGRDLSSIPSVPQEIAHLW